MELNGKFHGLYDLEFKLYDNPGPFAAQEGNTIEAGDLDVIDYSTAILRVKSVVVYFGILLLTMPGFD